MTDRILDTNLQWLKGKSVTIIDDALVSGTTIRKTIDKLLSIVDPEKIKVYVLSVNSEWYKRTETDLSKKYPYEMLVRTDSKGNVLFDKLGKPMSFLIKPPNYQTNEKCMRTCFDIVKALSMTPKPYDIDFPLYEDIKIDKKQLDVLFNNHWLPVNITPITKSTVSQIKPESSVESTCNSISFFPPNEIEKLILSIFELSSKSCSIKIRSYIRERKKIKLYYIFLFFLLQL
ncbi:phosphoribosyltransferase family protein [Eubacterium sp.]|uniref:phosphoribosyltransferase family protein n=1 Tax=Eubacterium sp. TaxID=142586 RepID=UPI0040257693